MSTMVSIRPRLKYFANYSQTLCIVLVSSLLYQPPESLNAGAIIPQRSGRIFR
jgi:hypothetical protein